MEPLTIFASTVGFIAGFHLISTTVDYFSKRRYDSGNRQEKREDWYCFFQPSDLLGSDWGTTDRGDHRQPNVSDDLEQRRRRQERRPRLQA